METLPLGASGLIDVKVRVHQSGKNCTIAEIVHVAAVRNLSERDNRQNPLSLHQHGGRSDAFGSDHSPGDEDLVTHRFNRRVREGVWT
jgi:ribulose 1,5-bisphosphate carboxylase large subunit-like protein